MPSCTLLSQDIVTMTLRIHLTKIVTCIFTYLCLSHLVHAGQVVDLTSENFNHLSSTHELVFINFYADWCRFSQILAPIFEEAYVKTLKEFGTPGRVLFAKVDCEKESDLAARFHISKYPTLKLLMNGKQMKKEYRGQRSVEAIVNHVKEILKDPVKSLVTFTDFEGIDQKKAAIIGYFQVLPGATPDYTTFRKVATDLREDCNFYWVTGEPTVIQLRDGVDHKISFKPTRSKPQEKDLLYPGSASSYDELSTWATDKCIPLVREITFENAEELTEEGLPFLILFHKPDDKKSVEDYTEIIHKELYTESASVNFLTADGLKFAHPLHHLGKTQQDLPLIAIDSFRHMYLFPHFGDLRVPGKLKQFVQDLHSGKLHREFHFGPDPAVSSNDQGQGEKEATSPPESTFKKLAPSSNRYTLLRDEL